MPEDKVIDRERFSTRLSKLYDFWLNGGHESLENVDAILFLVSKGDEALYCKWKSLHIWLFGYELDDVLAVMTKNAVVFLCSNRKAQFLKPVVSEESRGQVPPVSCIVHNKVEDDNKDTFKQMIEKLKEAGAEPVLGRFAKEKTKSEFGLGWKKALKEAGLDSLTVKDISTAIGSLLATKDEMEIDLLRKAANVSVCVWNNYLRKKLREIINLEQKVKHSTLAEQTEKSMTDVKVIGGIRKEHIESCYDPIIQSGGTYSLKVSGESDNRRLHYGTILSMFGARYSSYCSNVARTMLVDPPSHITDLYEHLLVTETEVINALKPGNRVCDAFEAGLQSVRDKCPDLLEKLNKGNFGFATGLEFRDGSILIGPETKQEIKPGMAFIVFIGFQDLTNESATDEESKKFALLLSDTVLVTENGNEVLTREAISNASLKGKGIVVRFVKEDETVEGRKEANKENRRQEEVLGRGKRSVIIQDQTRNKETNEDKRKEKQRELMNQLNDEAKQRISSQTSSQNEKRSKKSNISYKSYEKFPRDKEISELNIFIDRKHDTIILPIFGMPVPFHISMIKNTSHSVEGDFTYLRINFTHPGSFMGGKDAGQFPNSLVTYLKEMTYRSSNHKELGELSAPSSSLVTAFRLIKEMQKKFKTEEAEEREKEGTVKQDKLVLSQNKANPRLKDLYVRPLIIAKRISGTLEAHTNGFRYTSLRGDKIDVLYNNIKHAFFQRCDNEMIILLHFHLKNPVLWGKKKYTDIQFYTEVGEITTDLAKFHHMQDRDDIMAEQAEREMRHKLNLAFKSFTEKVERQTNNQVDFDEPFPELGFFGVPFRSNCTLKPTSSCLVNLTESPQCIITLDEVELVHFERVSFQLKAFDMVFVFKDYNRKPQMVQQIPMSSLDNVKEWLNSCEIRYTEGLQSLNWPKIMKTILDDPNEFFSTGGWSFLNPESDAEGEEEEDSDADEDAYVPSGEDSEDEEDEEGEEDDESPDATSESESEASVGSEDSSGKEWSDLEEEARKADKAKDLGVEEVPVRSKEKSKHHHKRHQHSPAKGGPSNKKRK